MRVVCARGQEFESEAGRLIEKEWWDPLRVGLRIGRGWFHEASCPLSSYHPGITYECRSIVRIADDSRGASFRRMRGGGFISANK